MKGLRRRSRRSNAVSPVTPPDRVDLLILAPACSGEGARLLITTRKFLIFLKPALGRLGVHLVRHHVQGLDLGGGRQDDVEGPLEDGAVGALALEGPAILPLGDRDRAGEDHAEDLPPARGRGGQHLVPVREDRAKLGSVGAPVELLGCLPQAVQVFELGLDVPALLLAGLDRPEERLDGRARRDGVGELLQLAFKPAQISERCGALRLDLLGLARAGHETLDDRFQQLGRQDVVRQIPHDGMVDVLHRQARLHHAARITASPVIVARVRQTRPAGAPHPFHGD